MLTCTFPNLRQTKASAEDENVRAGLYLFPRDSPKLLLRWKRGGGIRGLEWAI